MASDVEVVAASDTGNRLRRLEVVLAAVQRLDAPARDVADEAVAALLDLHGDALERIVELMTDAQLAALAEDPLTGQVLLLHGLHPSSQEARVRQAVERVRPYVAAHGGSVEVLSVVGSAVRARLQGGGPMAPLLRYAVEQAIIGAAPELIELEVSE